MYLLARELTGRRDAAFLAGLAFAFGPMRALHVSHLQVLAWGWMPIALWGLHRYFAWRSWSGARGVRVRVHRRGACRTATSSFSSPSRRRSSSSTSWRRVAHRRPSACARIGALAAASAIDPDLRRRGGDRVRVGAAAVWHGAARTTTGRCSAPTCDRMCRRRRPCGCGARWLNGDAAAERQLFPGLVTTLCAAAALWPGRARRRVAVLYGALAVDRVRALAGPGAGGLVASAPAVGPVPVARATGSRAWTACACRRAWRARPDGAQRARGARRGAPAGAAARPLAGRRGRGARRRHRRRGVDAAADAGRVRSRTGVRPIAARVSLARAAAAWRRDRAADPGVVDRADAHLPVRHARRTATRS